MSNGRVVEQGTHDDLLAREGIYHGLVEAQHICAEADQATERDISQFEHDTSYLSKLAAKTDDVPIVGIHKSTTMPTISKIDFEASAKSGIVEKRQYSTFYLIKKVIFHCLLS